ncbi:hypothetical protein CHUAL_007270 [Chamberlinius hualienensis]
MGRSKNQQKKIQHSRAVLKVAGDKSLKAKTKAKPVTTNLRKINEKTKDGVEKCNKQLESIQHLIRVKPKKVTIDKAKSNSQKLKDEPMPVDVDATAEEFNKL